MAALLLGAGGGGGVTAARTRLADLGDGGAAERERGEPDERELTKVQRDLFMTDGKVTLFANVVNVHAGHRPRPLRPANVIPVTAV